ncbi:lysozyme, partial [Enterovirga rhinocerotis]
MNVSARGLAEIVSHEGIVTRRYKDSVGVWTIGVGHTKAAGAPDPATFMEDLTVAESLALFR